MSPPGRLLHGESLDVLGTLPTGSIDLIYIDPPFNTGKTRSHARITVQASAEGTRTGFGGRNYAVTQGVTRSYEDAFDDYCAWLEPRLVEAHRVLAPSGSLYLHLDYREVHYCKVMLDAVFGRDNFLNEIIWAYDYGGRGKRRWPAKHDSILFYARQAGSHVFNLDEIGRIPYMAPGLVTPEKAARGKLPTDTWWQTIVPTNGSERTGYPTQKPLAIVSRIVKASSPPGGLVLDFFCGSGTTAVAAHQAGRRFIAADQSDEAIRVTRDRLAGLGIRYGLEEVSAASGLAADGTPGNRQEKSP
ncbi:MAG: DNA-methyltransferase [Candidatus Dormibacteria bacterium]